MKYWYCIIREPKGKIRARVIPQVEAQTQEACLKEMKFAPQLGEVVVELEQGSSLTKDDFRSYVNWAYQSDKKITLTDLENLIGAY